MLFPRQERHARSHQGERRLVCRTETWSSLFHLAIAAFKIEILAEWALSKAIPTDWPSRPARLSSANGIICPLELLAALSGILTMGDALRRRSIHFTEVGEPLVRARLQADHTQGGMRVGELD